MLAENGKSLESPSIIIANIENAFVGEMCENANSCALTHGSGESEVGSVEHFCTIWLFWFVIPD